MYNKVKEVKDSSQLANNGQLVEDNDIVVEANEAKEVCLITIKDAYLPIKGVIYLTLTKGGFLKNLRIKDLIIKTIIGLNQYRRELLNISTIIGGGTSVII